MRIIHNNLETQKTIPKTQEYDCEHCGSTIEVDADDLHEGWLGAMWFTCPVCGKENMSDVKTEFPTKDSIEFPKHFSKCSVDNGAVNTSDKDIQDYIRKLAQSMWDCTNEMDWNIYEVGNTFIFVENQSPDKDYRIIVCKDYYVGMVQANPNDKDYGGG